MDLRNLLKICLVILIGSFTLGVGLSIAKTLQYAHWAKEKMPLKVYIEKNTNQNYAADVVRAFAKWKSDTRGLVNFTIVNDKNQADIQVSWINKMKKEDLTNQAKGHSYVWGITKLGNPTKIILVTKHPLNDNQSLSANNIYMIALHEIGHSLGIWWHTKDPKDIMYPDFVVPSTTSSGARMITNQNTGSLSSRDVQNLLALYNRNDVYLLNNLAKGSNIQLASHDKSDKGMIETTGAAAASVTNKSTKLNLNLGDALNFLKQNPNSFEAYNNIGLIYMENNQNDKALDAFAKALQLNPTNADTHLNMAIALTNAKQYKLAIIEFKNYLKLAPDATNVEDIKKQIKELSKQI